MTLDKEKEIELIALPHRHRNHTMHLKLKSPVLVSILEIWICKLRLVRHCCSARLHHSTLRISMCWSTSH